MFVLFETPGGYGLFKVMDNSLLKDKSKLRKQFEKASSAQKALSLVDFHKFANTTEALSASTALVESKLHTSLRRFLRNQIKGKEGFTLGVSDTKLGKAISSKLNCSIAADENVQTILRGIRLHLDSFLSSQPSSSSDATTNMNMMRLGLAHSLSRYKLKFSPDKVDTMIVQAIALLDDLDKELNNYAMRCLEWYGWHFPELSKLIADHQTFARVVRLMGDRFSATKVDLSAVLPEDLVEEVRNVAKVSMGTDIAEEDIQNVISLCDQVIALGEYREQLYDYLKNRMQAIAPQPPPPLAARPTTPPSTASSTTPPSSARPAPRIRARCPACSPPRPSSPSASTPSVGTTPLPSPSMPAPSSRTAPARWRASPSTRAPPPPREAPPLSATTPTRTAPAPPPAGLTPPRTTPPSRPPPGARTMAPPRATL